MSREREPYWIFGNKKRPRRCAKGNRDPGGTVEQFFLRVQKGKHLVEEGERVQPVCMGGEGGHHRGGKGGEVWLSLLRRGKGRSAPKKKGKSRSLTISCKERRQRGTHSHIGKKRVPFLV